MNTKETSADKTKYRLAEAAKKCMVASGTDAMTVTQIVQTCGVTRQTFLSELPGQIRPDQLVF